HNKPLPVRRTAPKYFTGTQHRPAPAYFQGCLYYSTSLKSSNCLQKNIQHD
ncbi:Hypothetical protein FKW44_015451, partial [Caligus rogercresseyi]